MHENDTLNEKLAFVEGRYHDFDELSEQVAGWNVDLKQLETGELTASVSQILSPELAIGRARFDRRCLQGGSAPAGHRTIALLDTGSSPAVFCGQIFDAQNLVHYGDAGEVVCTSQPGFNVLTLSVPDDFLERQAELHGFGPPRNLLPQTTRVTDCNPLALKRLRLRLKRLADLPKAPETREAAPRMLTQSVDELGGSLLSLFHDCGHDRNRTAATGNKQRMLRRARSYIAENLADPVTVSGLAMALGVTTRTIEYLFRDSLDITPSEYIRTTRLHALRQALKVAGPSRKINEIAQELGYWHMGQLARDYRTLFGELPSQTRRR